MGECFQLPNKTLTFTQRYLWPLSLLLIPIVMTWWVFLDSLYQEAAAAHLFQQELKNKLSEQQQAYEKALQSKANLERIKSDVYHLSLGMGEHFTESQFWAKFEGMALNHGVEVKRLSLSKPSSNSEEDTEYRVLLVGAYSDLGHFLSDLHFSPLPLLIRESRWQIASNYLDLFTLYISLHQIKPNSEAVMSELQKGLLPAHAASFHIAKLLSEQKTFQMTGRPYFVTSAEKENAGKCAQVEASRLSELRSRFYGSLKARYWVAFIGEPDGRFLKLTVGDMHPQLGLSITKIGHSTIEAVLSESICKHHLLREDSHD